MTTQAQHTQDIEAVLDYAEQYIGDHELGTPEYTHLANARTLMRAAPDLYEALNHILRACSKEDTAAISVIQHYATTAIAKAEGR